MDAYLTQIDTRPRRRSGTMGRDTPRDAPNAISWSSCPRNGSEIPAIIRRPRHTVPAKGGVGARSEGWPPPGREGVGSKRRSELKLALPRRRQEIIEPVQSLRMYKATEPDGLASGFISHIPALYPHVGASLTSFSKAAPLQRPSWTSSKFLGVTKEKANQINPYLFANPRIK